LTVKLDTSTGTISGTGTTSGTGTPTGTPTGTTTADPVSKTLVHGVLMWVAWTVFSILQIGSKRWFSSSVAIAYYAHLIGGTIISILSVSSFIVVLQHFNWNLMLKNTHTVSGFTFLCLALILVSVGVVGHFMRYTDKEWDVN